MDCPKCKKELEKREGMFYLPEKGLMPGMVCADCNALYNSEEFTLALEERTKFSKVGLD